MRKTPKHFSRKKLQKQLDLFDQKMKNLHDPSKNFGKKKGNA